VSYPGVFLCGILADEEGVYYHVDYVGDPRSYKWINTIQLSKTVEQVSGILSFNMEQAYTL
jgi:hypothetical protein